MMSRGLALGLAVAVLCPALAQPQALEIDHKAVGCIVVGKYPKMNACFTPQANLARGRVYFRPEGTPSWYYVDMKSDQPCFAGTLPRPGKKLVGKKIEYYVEGQDKTFNPARTAEYGPVVVRSAQECKKDVPVAPFLNNATVAVFPGLPAGFVGGGIGTAAVIGIAAVGAAAAGTAAVVASNDDTTTTTLAVAGIPTTTTTLPAATTTTTTQPKAANKAPFVVLKVSPDPPSGPGPLTVTFDLCQSSDPDGDPLSFFFNFGDGSQTSGSCLESHTYAAPFRSSSGVHAADATYVAEGSAVDPQGASATKTRTVNVGSAPSNCPTPRVVLSPPPPVSCDEVVVRAQATDAESVTFCSSPANPARCFSPFAGPQAADAPTPACANGRRSGNTYTAKIGFANGSGCYGITAVATNDCGNTASDGPKFTFNDCGSSFSALRKNEPRTTVWSSDLSIDGRLQVVVNGASPAFPGRGRGFGSARLVDGENRVEAVVVESAGKPGLWRIDLKPSEAILAGSLRVVSGEAVLVGPASATFRLSGNQGERIVFSFMKK
jgi:PKD domain-containing protein